MALWLTFLGAIVSLKEPDGPVPLAGDGPGKVVPRAVEAGTARSFNYS
jgi:hypothetical protein